MEGSKGGEHSLKKHAGVCSLDSNGHLEGTVLGVPRFATNLCHFFCLCSEAPLGVKEIPFITTNEPVAATLKGCLSGCLGQKIRFGMFCWGSSV